MSTLAEIEAAVEQLPLPEQKTLLAILAGRLEEVSETEGSAQTGWMQLLDLAKHAQPMGNLTNAQIDQAVYGG